jgi:hypothetical protein
MQKDWKNLGKFNNDAVRKAIKIAFDNAQGNMLHTDDVNRIFAEIDEDWEQRTKALVDLEKQCLVKAREEVAKELTLLEHYRNKIQGLVKKDDELDSRLHYNCGDY